VFVSSVSPDPSASITQMSLAVASSLRVKAIFSPFGDQSGEECVSVASSVRFIGSMPSAFIE
jgi:hypothetical protein